MEKISCPHHQKSNCILKTGTNPSSTSYSKNFYVCIQKLHGSQCSFVRAPKKNIPVMSCPKHCEIVGVRHWHKTIPNRIVYSCSKRDSKYCGYYDREVSDGSLTEANRSDVPQRSSSSDGSLTEASRSDVPQRSSNSDGSLTEAINSEISFWPAKMEKISCPHHQKSNCILKTGTNPGSTSYSKNFYVCVQKLHGSQCSFVRAPKKNIPVMSCPKHCEIVGVRHWHNTIPNRIVYSCSKRDSKYCGYYDREVNKENQLPKMEAPSSSSGSAKAKHVPSPPVWDSAISFDGANRSDVPQHSHNSVSSPTEASRSDVPQHSHNSVSSPTEASRSDVPQHSSNSDGSLTEASRSDVPQRSSNSDGSLTEASRSDVPQRSSNSDGSLTEASRSDVPQRSSNSDGSLTEASRNRLPKMETPSSSSGSVKAKYVPSPPVWDSAITLSGGSPTQASRSDVPQCNSNFDNSLTEDNGSAGTSYVISTGADVLMEDSYASDRSTAVNSTGADVLMEDSYASDRSTAGNSTGADVLMEDSYASDRSTAGNSTGADVPTEDSYASDRSTARNSTGADVPTEDSYVSDRSTAGNSTGADVPTEDSYASDRSTAGNSTGADVPTDDSYVSDRSTAGNSTGADVPTEDSYVSYRSTARNSTGADVLTEDSYASYRSTTRNSTGADVLTEDSYVSYRSTTGNSTGADVPTEDSYASFRSTTGNSTGADVPTEDSYASDRSTTGNSTGADVPTEDSYVSDRSTAGNSTGADVPTEDSYVSDHSTARNSTGADVLTEDSYVSDHSTGGNSTGADVPTEDSYVSDRSTAGNSTGADVPTEDSYVSDRSTAGNYTGADVPTEDSYASDRSTDVPTEDSYASDHSIGGNSTGLGDISPEGPRLSDSSSTGQLNTTYSIRDTKTKRESLNKDHSSLRNEPPPTSQPPLARPAPIIISPPKQDPEVARQKHSLYLPPPTLKAEEEERVVSKPSLPALSSYPKEDEVKPDPEFKVGYQSRKVIQQIQEVESSIRLMAHKLPDGGAQLNAMRKKLYERLNQMKKPPKDLAELLQQQRVGNNVQARNITSQARMLTSGAVEHLHESLKNCPTEDVLSEDPDGMVVTLMHHQKRALAWMKWREEQIPSAGILADDMGLGKTLSMLSLVVASKNDPESKEWLSHPPAREGLTRTGCTLIVCPASLMIQWEKEIKSRFKKGTLSAHVYHGSSRTKYPLDLVRHDVVITSYHTVGAEGTSCSMDDEVSSKPADPKKRTSSFSTLFQIHWRRVILDEAHVIRNHKTGLSKGACHLSAYSRWALTGTPIQNKLLDFYSLIKFIQLAPFDDFRVWRDTVEKKGSVGMRRLNTMVSSLVLRRTKEELAERQELTLTQRRVKSHMISLRQEERDIYQVIFTEARVIMCKWLDEQGEAYKPINEESKEKGSNLPPAEARLVSMIMNPYLTGSRGRCVLGLLLRLRQCCCHLNLLTSALDKAEANQDLVLEVAMSALSLDKEDSVDHPFSQDNLPLNFKKEKSSTKIQEVIAELKRISSLEETPPQKSIIVSQWTSMLTIVAHQLETDGITYSRIDGSVSPRERQSRMERFNAPGTGPVVMLLSLQAGGVGLNLIGANHVFMLDMHWNPALEAQAADRCHRMGQKRDVFVHKFICEGTVEERILLLQQKKLMLAKNILEGASEKTRKARNQLSLSDLKNLFDI